MYFRERKGESEHEQGRGSGGKRENVKQTPTHGARYQAWSQDLEITT